MTVTWFPHALPQPSLPSHLPVLNVLMWQFVTCWETADLSNFACVFISCVACWMFFKVGCWCSPNHIASRHKVLNCSPFLISVIVSNHDMVNTQTSNMDGEICFSKQQGCWTCLDTSIQQNDRFAGKLKLQPALLCTRHNLKLPAKNILTRFSEVKMRNHFSRLWNVSFGGANQGTVFFQLVTQFPKMNWPHYLWCSHALTQRGIVSLSSQGWTGVQEKWTIKLYF